MRLEQKNILWFTNTNINKEGYEVLKYLDKEYHVYDYLNLSKIYDGTYCGSGIDNIIHNPEYYFPIISRHLYVYHCDFYTHSGENYFTIQKQQSPEDFIHYIKKILMLQ